MFQTILIKYDQKTHRCTLRAHSAFIYPTREAAISAGVSEAIKRGYDPSKLALLTLLKGKAEGMILTVFQGLRGISHAA